MEKNFKSSLAKVLVHEGGYSNHPKDPGGATMKGVTQKVYDAFRKGKGQALRSVKSITTAELETIYKRQYWDAVHGDELPTGVDYLVFDGAVNSGPSRSIKWLQKSLNGYKGPIDGHIGLGTMAALENERSYTALIGRVCDNRLAFLKALKTWPTFRGGWEARVAGVRKVSTQWAADGDDKALPILDNIYEGGEGNEKATVEGGEEGVSKAPGDLAVGSGGIGLILSQAAEQLQAFAANQNVQRILIGITIASMVIAAGGLAYRFYAKRKEARLKDALDIPQ